MKKVILIGGSPMIGKSTVATLVAAYLKYACISTDDIGEALQTVADINPMQGRHYLDYYADTSKAKLVADIQQYHKVIEPAMKRIIDIHSTWGNPLLIEGWAIYPEFARHLNNENIFPIFLIATAGVLATRLRNKGTFLENSENDVLITENYLYRSEWHNKLLLEQCLSCNLPYVMIGGDETPEQLSNIILKSFL